MVMNKDEKLAQIASDNAASYASRKDALDDIRDKRLINRLAETANDDWIRLESAIISKNRKVLLF
jgi:hypothetical protein